MTLVSLFNMRLYVPVRAVVSDGLDHRLDLPVQFLAIFAPEVGFRCVYNEFHVFAISLQDRMVRENTQMLLLLGGFGAERGQGREGHRVLKLFNLVRLLLL